MEVGLERGVAISGRSVCIAVAAEFLSGMEIVTIVRCRNLTHCIVACAASCMEMGQMELVLDGLSI